MDNFSPLSLEASTQLLKALSDDSRLRIMHLLLHKTEMCVSDLELILDFTQTKTSRHLTYLRNARLVNGRKLDQRTFYRITEELIPFMEHVFAYVNKEDPVLRKDLETYQILYATEELAISRLHKKRWESERENS